ncbi:Nucleotide-diphospho-sugar transferase [Balamuthia mandrillaris]
MTRQRCTVVVLAFLWTLFVLWTGRPERSSDASTYQATSVQLQALKQTLKRLWRVHKDQDTAMGSRRPEGGTLPRRLLLGAFNQVINIHDTDFRDEARRIQPLKVRSFQLSPYRATVFLDPDTMACGDVDEMFGLLEYLDLAAAYAPGTPKVEIIGGEGPIKAVFPEINTGVLAYRDTEATRRLFQTWDYITSNSPNRMDQPAFRVALLGERNVRFHVLLPEFMCRFTANRCGTTVMMQGLNPVQKLPAVPCGIIHSKRIQKDVEPFPSDLNLVA